MKLVYQKNDSDQIDAIDIVDKAVPTIEKAILDGKGIYSTKLGLNLRATEIKGLFTQEQYETMKVMWVPKKVNASGYANFLEMGKAMKERRNLERFKA
jgi:hypothetical protein